MAEPELLVEVAGGVGRLVLNRPRALNALTAGMIAGLHSALNAWRVDDAVATPSKRGTSCAASAPASATSSRRA